MRDHHDTQAQRQTHDSDHKKTCVLVLGLGEIGKPLYQIIQASGIDVVGVDVTPQQIDTPVSVMHVCYPYNIASGFVATTVAYVAKYNPDVVVIHSTVAPGTTRAIETQCMRSCVYSPVRGKHVRMVDDLKHYTKFVAGQSDAAVQRVQAHLQHIGMKTEALAAPESLELAKLFETTYFGLLIAWAQDMHRMAQSTNADYYDLARFFAEIPYLPPRVFVPGHIGGHCVMPNIDILKQYFQSEFLDAIQTSNARVAHDAEASRHAVPTSATDRPRHEPLTFEKK